MVEYVVTTRNAKGLREERAYTAENRSDLFKKLAADGIHAISVREGTLGKKPRKAASSGAPSKVRGLIAAAVVVLGAGVAAWFMWPEREQVVEEKKEVKVDKKPVLSRPQKKVEQKEDVAVRLPPVPGETPEERHDRISHNRAVLKAKAEAEIAAGIRPAPKKRKSPYKYSFQHAIAMAMSVPAQGALPPIPITHNMEVEFKKYIEEPIKISDDDTEEMRLWKESLESARLEIKERIDAGDSFAGVLSNHRDLFNENQKIRDEAIAEAVSILANQGEDAAQEYVGKINDAFGSMAIDYIDKPKMTKEEAIRVVELRNARREYKEQKKDLQ